jgi:hypothetical protein
MPTGKRAEGKRSVTWWIWQDLHGRIKAVAEERGVSVNEAAARALDEAFPKADGVRSRRSE